MVCIRLYTIRIRYNLRYSLLFNSFSKICRQALACMPSIWYPILRLAYLCRHENKMCFFLISWLLNKPNWRRRLSKIRICRSRLSIFGCRRRHQPTPHYAWLWTLVQAVNRTSGRSGSANEDDPAERGCSRSRTTLGSTPTTSGGSHMTASLGGRYDLWPVKHSSAWASDCWTFSRVSRAW